VSRWLGRESPASCITTWENLQGIPCDDIINKPGRHQKPWPNTGNSAQITLMSLVPFTNVLSSLGMKLGLLVWLRDQASVLSREIS
jgi:hypothetical protein